MTTRTVIPAIDPTGLGGDRICRLTPEGAPECVELWCYPTSRDFEAIADAWFIHGGRVAAERIAGSVRYFRVTRAPGDE